jgi:hypothetical protein
MVGIDKLELTTREWDIKSWRDSNLTLFPTPEKAGEDAMQDFLVIRDKAGVEKRGQKAILNNELFSLTLNQYGARLTMNPSKPYNPVVLCSDDATFADRVSTVQNRLKEYGIWLNMFDAKLSRVDVAKNVLCKNPVSHYSDVFRGLRLPRANKQAEYPEGYRSNNKSRSLIFYNKGQEVFEKTGDSIVLELHGNNLMRGELQYKKGSIPYQLKMKTFDDLSRAGMESLQTVYRNTMEKSVFRYDAGEVVNWPIRYDEESLLNELISILEKHPRNGYLHYRAVIGDRNIPLLWGSLENFSKAILTISENRGTADRIVKAIRQTIFGFGPGEVVSLYKELKTEFLKVA